MTNPDEHRAEQVGGAIAVLTAWAETTMRAEQQALMWPLVEERVRAGHEETVDLALGLLRAATYLLVMLEDETGRTMTEILHEVALRSR